MRNFVYAIMHYLCLWNYLITLPYLPPPFQAPAACTLFSFHSLYSILVNFSYFIENLALVIATLHNIEKKSLLKNSFSWLQFIFWSFYQFILVVLHISYCLVIRK